MKIVSNIQTTYCDLSMIISALYNLYPLIINYQTETAQSRRNIIHFIQLSFYYTFLVFYIKSDSSLATRIKSLMLHLCAPQINKNLTFNLLVITEQIFVFLNPVLYSLAFVFHPTRPSQLNFVCISLVITVFMMNFTAVLTLVPPR